VEEARREHIKKKLEIAASPGISNIEKFFLHDAQNAVKVLEDLNKDPVIYSAEEFELYITTVHGIKSALANIGQAELSQKASELETAGREKNTEVMSSETPALKEALKFLIEKLTPKENTGNTSVSADDLSFLKEKMLEINVSCGELNKKAAKKAMNELYKKTWPVHINSALSNISTLLLHSDFNRAAEIALQTASLTNVSAGQKGTD